MSGPPEIDPHGKPAHQRGAKLDAGKNRLGLVLLGFARALREVGEVGTFGARKYTEDGWIEVENGRARYTDALLRHLVSEATGEKREPATGLRHAAQVAWNALARLDLEIRQEEGQSGKSRGEMPPVPGQTRALEIPVPQVSWTGGEIPAPSITTHDTTKMVGVPSVYRQ